MNLSTPQYILDSRKRTDPAIIKGMDYLELIVKYKKDWIRQGMVPHPDLVNAVFERLEGEVVEIFNKYYKPIEEKQDVNLIKRVFVKTALNFQYAKFVIEDKIQTGRRTYTLKSIDKNIAHFCKLFELDPAIWNY